MPINENDFKHDYNEKIIQPAMRKLKERSFGDYLDISIVVMVIGLFVAIVFTFLVDFVFDTTIDWKEISVNTVIISVCTIAIYLLLRTYAMRKGRKTKAWIEASERLNSKGKEMIESDSAQYIVAYCRDWEEERLNNDIEDALSPVGIKLKDYKEKYAKLTKKELSNASELTKYQRKVVAGAKRIRRLKFDERYFCVNSSGYRRHRSPSSGLTSKQMNRLATGRIILTTVLISLVTASLLRDIIIDFSWASIMKCVIKIAIIIFFGVIGMVSGYSFAAVRETAEMNEKADEIEIFLKWCKNQNQI
ncbi:MAG: hypothetical protein K2K80_05540 [Clostridia bacterium]|nr:hypothetical protein [Clostridia bacterium]